MTERKVKQIRVELSDREWMAIEQFLPGTANVDGSDPLTLKTLVELLLQDVAMTMTRPGSWEGSNMIRVFEGHGL